FLARLSRDFPWRGPESPFLGYNHSVKQAFLYYFGVTPINTSIVTFIKLVLLAPLGWVSLKLLRTSQGQPLSKTPEKALALALVLYRGAFIWLYNVWELSLGLVLFAYLLTITKEKWSKIVLWALYGPYILLDIWRLVSYIALGDAVLYDGAYVLTDPLIYVPWIMVTLLVSYALLLKKLTTFTENPA